MKVVANPDCAVFVVPEPATLLLPPFPKDQPTLFTSVFMIVTVELELVLIKNHSPTQNNIRIVKPKHTTKMSKGIGSTIKV